VLKEAGILAAEIVGFPKFKRDKHGDIVPGSVQATGKDGLIGYLTFVALNEPRAYLGFLEHFPVVMKHIRRCGNSWRILRV
jgi:hypothetical protein